MTTRGQRGLAARERARAEARIEELRAKFAWKPEDIEIEEDDEDALSTVRST